MIHIKIAFPAGRWHATAWGSHVNEGVAEWPPCPWRLCRALIATWYLKHRGKDADLLNSLITKLSSNLPDYHLPKASSAHTRHYMPVNEGKKEIRTKIFDTFVHVNEDDTLWIRWYVLITEEERTLLSTLLQNMSYMGRAESLVDASLAPTDECTVATGWTTPVEHSSLLDGESVKLLAPELAPAYSSWLESNQQDAAGKKSKSKKKAPSLPVDIFTALHQDTADWKKDGWNYPPGSRWIEYKRPQNCFSISPISFPHKKRATNLPTVARFAVVSKVPPSITQSLSLAERLHQALCSKLKNEWSILTGKDMDNNPLKDNQHVYFLPECDSKGYITHMTLHSPAGFDDTACKLFGRIRSVWGSEGFDVNLILLATGHADDFIYASPYFEKSTIWKSITPFIPVRHAKASRTGVPRIDPANDLQIGSPAHDCERLVKTISDSLKLDLPIRSVTPDEGARIRHGAREFPCLNFQRNRHTGGGTRAGNRGYSLTLEFDHPVSLPYGFGYAGHFGLGLFLPLTSEM